MRTKPISQVGMKWCSKCKTFQEKNHFGLNRSRPDGLTYWCKDCQLSYMEKTKEHRLCYHKKYYEDHKEYCIAKAIEWQKENPEKRREYSKKTWKKWSSANPDKIREINRRKRSSAKGKVNYNISRAIRKSLGNGNKRGHHWELLVGYTISQLKQHLEKKFTPGMTWENYGSHWNIDHIIPISAFNFSSISDADFKRCWSLKNIQPLEAKVNFSKGGKLGKPFQPGLAL